jgi:hypothetical protein
MKTNKITFQLKLALACSQDHISIPLTMIKRNKIRTGEKKGDEIAFVTVHTRKILQNDFHKEEVK